MTKAVAYRIWNKTDPNADWELHYEVPAGMNADHFIVEPLYTNLEITNEMVERAAKALYETDDSWSGAFPFDEKADYDKNIYRILARRALESTFVQEETNP